MGISISNHLHVGAKPMKHTGPSAKNQSTRAKKKNKKNTSLYQVIKEFMQAYPQLQDRFKAIEGRSKRLNQNEQSVQQQIIHVLLPELFASIVKGCVVTEEEIQQVQISQVDKTKKDQTYCMLREQKAQRALTEVAAILDHEHCPFKGLDKVCLQTGKLMGSLRYASKHDLFELVDGLLNKMNNPIFRKKADFLLPEIVKEGRADMFCLFINSLSRTSERCLKNLLKETAKWYHKGDKTRALKMFAEIIKDERIQTTWKSLVRQNKGLSSMKKDLSARLFSAYTMNKLLMQHSPLSKDMRHFVFCIAEYVKPFAMDSRKSMLTLFDNVAQNAIEKSQNGLKPMEVDLVAPKGNIAHMV